MPHYADENGHTVPLGKELGKGGEGSVYAINGNAGMVAKVFHANRQTSDRHAKIQAMISRKPADRTMFDPSSGKKVPTIAWPEHLLLEKGAFKGFLMPTVDTSKAVELWEIVNKTQRETKPWTADFGFGKRCFVALNLAIQVDQIHRIGAVIGDFNDRNTLVSDQLLVTVIDCDSMQVPGASGQVHLNEMWTVGHCAPELVGKDLRKTVREQSADLFNLAVHIYMLAFDGQHPFRNGIWNGQGDKPGADQLAKTGAWRGKSGGLLQPQPNQLDPRIFLDSTTLALFERAFSEGAKDPKRRPGATEWRDEMARVIGSWRPVA